MLKFLSHMPGISACGIMSQFVFQRKDAWLDGPDVESSVRKFLISYLTFPLVAHKYYILLICLSHHLCRHASVFLYLSFVCPKFVPSVPNNCVSVFVSSSKQVSRRVSL